MKSSTGQIVGNLLTINGRTLTVANSAGYVFNIYLEGNFVPGQMYFTSAGCAGTPNLNGLAVGGRRYYKQLGFSTDRNKIYTLSNPNTNNVATAASIAFTSMRNTDGTQTNGASTACDATPGNQPVWSLTEITPAAAGIPVVANSNPLSVGAPLTFQ